MTDFLFVGFILILGMGAYWVFFLMPRQHDFVQRQKMARELQAGDEIITGGGLVGKVQMIDAEKGVAYVEIAEGLEVRVVTAAILSQYDPDVIAQNARKGRPTDEEVE